MQTVSEFDEGAVAGMCGRNVKPRETYSQKDIKLTDYAYIPMAATFPPHLNALNIIERKAKPESWGIGGDGHAILRNYIKQTFLKVYKEGSFQENADAQFAAFNTGLETVENKDIYACFVPNDRAWTQRWKFVGVCTKNDREDWQLGLKLGASFDSLPKRADYSEKSQGISFDSECKIECNWRHIICDRIDRFPASFVLRELSNMPFDIKDQLAQACDNTRFAPVEDVWPHPRPLIDYLCEDNEAYERIKDVLSNAISEAIDCSKMDSSNIVRVYYPRFDSMQMLIPLFLDESNRASAAIVLSNDSDTYHGRTVLTPSMAYADARVVGEPKAKWLKQLMV